MRLGGGLVLLPLNRFVLVSQTPQPQLCCAPSCVQPPSGLGTYRARFIAALSSLSWVLAHSQQVHVSALDSFGAYIRGLRVGACSGECHTP